MRPSAAVRLALAGTRTDALRVVLTTASGALATVVLLLAVTVLAIPTPGKPGDTSSDSWSRQYRLELLVEPGLRPGVVIALVLLAVPVLVLAGQCGRLGAPARDRRLAAIRMAGATPRQTAMLAATETGVATALGALLGLAGYLAGRVLLHRPDAEGRLLLPTDVPPPWPGIGVVCVGLPLLAMAVTVVLLRRVSFTPFGVVRRTRTRAPRPWPVVLVVAGFGLISLLQPLARWADRRHWTLPVPLFPILLFVAVLLAAVGVVVGTGSVSHAAGRILHRFARRPAALLAARRLMADPWSGSRTFAVLLVCVLFGAGAAAVRAWFASDFATSEEASRWMARAQGQPYVPRDTSFYFDSMDLVNGVVGVATALAAAGMLVAIVEGIVSRRRAYASLVATGVPRGTLARAILWQTFAPVVPAVLVALVAGAALPRGIAGESRAGGGSTQYCVGDWDLCQDPNSPNLRTLEVPTFAHTIPVPFADLAVVGVGALAAVLLVVGAGLLVLRSATSVDELRSA
ncbi:ABC transporter permease [Planosporangium thailandense]|uniref:ABC transporter permease n=1 Tax=Planosporangium thailandense TaxID=765197 RepID=A0ABX0Y5C7_9ACTN|nr:FtsX-like permease family protein [Planosporangium thailandense]NJC72623.1 ABC transporter permease [Planosporangium thailandense]